MKAIVCEKFGPPEMLAQVDMPQPTPDDDSLLVNVHAAGVGFVDGLMVQGLYQNYPITPVANSPALWFPWARMSAT
jgi:NADPH2:quinone reductase